jgi:hypothetical protein
MSNQISRNIILFAIMAAGAAGVAGCKSACQANKEIGLAPIVCQPMNQTVKEGETASFEVIACGRGKEYQWYFDDGSRQVPLEDAKGYRNTHSAKLSVVNVSSNNVGRYFCRIVSYDSEKNPAITETRMATLGFLARTLPASLSIIDHQPIPPGSSGTSECGSYCAFLLFDNTTHTGYRPSGTGAGLARVKFSNNPNDLPTSSYELLWKTGPLDKGCATNFTTTQKSFPCNTAKLYKFIVYFKGAWPPPAGSGDVQLNLDF